MKDPFFLRYKKSIFLLITILSFIIFFLSVNSWSFWIDEAITARMFAVNNFSDILNELSLKSGSESQMPGWVITMWAWAKLFGIGEYALRAINWLYAVILFIYCAYLYFQKNIDKRRAVFILTLMVLTSISPLILYNMNEARCNFALYVFGGISILGVWSYYELNKKNGIFISLLSLFVGVTFNMLFGLLVVGLLIMILSYSRNIYNDIIKNRGVILFFIILSIPLIIYYFSAFMSGKGGQIETPGIGNIGYVFYEFMGFSGLGPPKNEIRQSVDKIATLLEYLPIMSLFFCSYILIFVLILWKKGFKYFISNIFFKTFIINFILFFIISYIADFRFWGRHALFIYPFFIMFMSDSLIDIAQQKSKLNYASVLLFVSLLAYSSINILFSDKYKKENIKLAAQKALEYRLNNETIIWTEGEDTAWYYGLNDTSYVKIGLPEINDSGLWVYFDRMEWWLSKDGNTVSPFEQHRERDILFENPDFTIYRIKK